MPHITVFFSAFNEADRVASRIENIFNTAYDASKMQLIVISDGSTDETARIVKQCAASDPLRKIRLIEFEINKGRAHAQNLVAELKPSEIVVATDADTVFEPSTLPNLIEPFSHDKVAVVGGIVNYRDPGNSVFAYGYNRYRDVERALRSAESELGVLVKVDGPCVAYRLSVWQPIRSFEDVDQVICLLAKKEGYIAVQAEEALSYDWANQKPEQEIRQRARMTRKALLSTFNRWGIKESIKYPGFTVVLWLHKVLRFFSPVFVCLVAVTAPAIVGWSITSAIGFGTVILVVLSRRARNAITGFLVAQVGFAAGILGWLSGDLSGSYTPTRKG